MKTVEERAEQFIEDVTRLFSVAITDIALAHAAKEREHIANFVQTHRVIWSSVAPHHRVERVEMDTSMQVMAAAIRALENLCE